MKDLVIFILLIGLATFMSGCAHRNTHQFHCTLSPNECRRIMVETQQEVLAMDPDTDIMLDRGHLVY